MGEPLSQHALIVSTLTPETSDFSVIKHASICMGVQQGAQPTVSDIMSVLGTAIGTLGSSLRRLPSQSLGKMAMTRRQPEEEGDEDRLVKCMVVGDSGVGKSCLLIRYTDDYFVFNSHDMPTGPVFDSETGHPVTMEVAGMEYTLVLYDTFSQPERETTRVACYPGTDVCLLCFSVVSPASFESIESKWLPEARRNLPRTPIILVGTQTDLRDDLSVVQHLGKSREFPVDFEEGEQLARRIKAKCYLECSALTMKGIEQVFDVAILRALRKRTKLKNTPMKRMRGFFGQLRKASILKKRSRSRVS